MTSLSTTIQERIPLPAAGPMMAAPAPSKTITPSEILGMLKQRLVTIILLSLLFCSGAVGLFVLLWTKFPSYSATAYVEVISNQPKPQFETEHQQLQKDVFERFIKSQAIYVTQHSILSKVLRDQSVRSTTWFKETEQDKRLGDLEDAVSCSAVRDTNYISVSMSTKDPKDPHQIVNALVTMYLNDVRERYSQPYRQQVADYNQELANVKQQIQQKKQQIQEFGATISPGDRPSRDGGGQGVLVEKLKKEQERVSEIELETAELQSLKELYTDPGRNPVTPEDRIQVDQDPRVNSLNNQVIALEQEINIMLERFGPNHRETQAMQSRLDEARRQLGPERDRKLREILEYKKEQIETAYYNSQNALLLAKERLAETQAQQADLDRKISEFNTLQDELDLLIEFQNRIDQYLHDIQKIVADRGAVRVESAVSAQAPENRSFPTLLMLPLMVFGGFAMAVGTAIGLELLDTSVRTPQDIVRHVNVSVLGSIPDVDDEEVEIEQLETAVRDAPQSMMTEAFRTVRSNLQFSAPVDRMHTILVTSPRPEDGKTTIASNLAASMAMGGRRVLLVDANLRRPALHRFYPSGDGTGLTNILIGEAKLEDCVQSTALPNLDVVCSGPVPPNPAELFGGELFAEFVREARDRYDHVIFDSPPVLLASDTTVLATQMDGVIVTIRAKGMSRGVANRACSLLEHVNAHVFGAVLNAARVRRGGYFREQLRTFYEYQADEDDDQRPPALPDTATDTKVADAGDDSTNDEKA